HEARGEQAHGDPSTRLTQKLHQAEVIPFVVEDFGARIAPVENVITKTAHRSSRRTWYERYCGWVLSAEQEQARMSQMVMPFSTSSAVSSLSLIIRTLPARNVPAAANWSGSFAGK